MKSIRSKEKSPLIYREVMCPNIMEKHSLSLKRCLIVYIVSINVSKLRLDIFEGMVKNRNIELLLRSWIAAHAGS